MQRSYVIKAIIRELDDMSVESPHWWRGDIAEQILTLIEDLGMEPPWTDNPNIRGYDVIYSKPEDFHKWEEE